jgi:hypothetical protein
MSKQEWRSKPQSMENNATSQIEQSETSLMCTIASILESAFLVEMVDCLVVNEIASSVVIFNGVWTFDYNIVENQHHFGSKRGVF